MKPSDRMDDRMDDKINNKGATPLFDEKVREMILFMHQLSSTYPDEIDGIFACKIAQSLSTMRAKYLKEYRTRTSTRKDKEQACQTCQTREPGSIDT